MTADPRSETLSLGVALRRAPGVTRWASEVWRVVGVFPCEVPGDWRELRRDGEMIDYHAATLPLTLHRAETEAYLTALNGAQPRIWAILRIASSGERPEPLCLTASAYEAQDYADNGEDLVEPLTPPPAVTAWIADFAARLHKEEPFHKRKRRNWAAPMQDGIGDPRIRQGADVYRAPTARREGEG